MNVHTRQIVQYVGNHAFEQAQDAAERQHFIHNVQEQDATDEIDNLHELLQLGL